MFYQQMVHLDNILYGEKVRVSVHVRPRFFASFVSSPCSADPVLIPTHTISRTTNSLDTITNRPAILTDRISQISQIFMRSCNITVSKLPSTWIKLQYWCPNENFFFAKYMALEII